MGERKHKAVDLEKTTNSKPGPKESPNLTHPIVQLQQTIGNRALTNMIQCHPQDMMERYDWWVNDLYSGLGPALLSTGSGRQQPQEAHERRHAAQGAHEQRHAQGQHEQSHRE